MLFLIGQRVTIHSRNRGGRGRIVDVTTNTLGTVLYWLNTGGCFGHEELQPD